MAVAALPALPATSVNTTLKVSNPSGSDETSMPVTSCVAELTVPSPVRGVPPPSLLMVYE